MNKKLLFLAAITTMVTILLQSCISISLQNHGVDEKKYLGTGTNKTDIYQGTGSSSILPLFNFAKENVDKILITKIADDDVYKMLELQIIDGKPAVLGFEKDGRTFKYISNGVKIGVPLHDKVSVVKNTPIDFSFSIKKSGIDVNYSFTDRKGRPIKVKITENDTRVIKRELMPFHSTDLNLNYFPAFYLMNMRIARPEKTKVHIQIGEHRRTPEKFPLKVDGDSLYMILYSDDFIETKWNKNYKGPLHSAAADKKNEVEYENGIYSILDNRGFKEISRVSYRVKNHRVYYRFVPAIPDLQALKEGATVKGRYSAGFDTFTGVFAGIYEVQKRDGKLTVSIDPRECFQPGLPVIPRKKWLEVYVWNADIDIKNNSMTAGWSRK